MIRNLHRKLKIPAEVLIQPVRKPPRRESHKAGIEGGAAPQTGGSGRHNAETEKRSTRQGAVEVKPPVTVRDGEEAHGNVEWWQDLHQAQPHRAPNLMIYKPAIKYMF